MSTTRNLGKPVF